MTVVPGATLGIYKVTASLGRGGMGEVYRARDPRLDRDVALKVLPADVAADPARLARFDREARAIAALNHPHIVTIHSNEEADGVRFLTMELIDGETLTEVIAAGPIALMRFFDIALALADALTAAHQKQITHRDLKPANVMVSREGRVKVLDFGLARIGSVESGGESSLTATRPPTTEPGMLLGTLPYMSPEQLEGRPLDPRTDLFSLGVILHELLRGGRLFRGDSSPAIIAAILRDTPASVRATRADIPEGLARLIARCLEKRADDRIQTARDVYNELAFARAQLDPGLLAPSPPAAPRNNLAVSEGPDSATIAPSIAVLPFADLSPAGDQAWFCDGIAEEILNALAPLSGLHVAARVSSFSMRDKTDDLKSIGEKLNVTTVLEGSVRRAGERVRITAQLSLVETGRQLWSARFDRELTDIFDVQDDIARAIVGRLKVTLADNSRARLVPKVTDHIGAYELLLKGRVQLTRRGRAILDAMTTFEQAIALDPQLTEAHALLADAHRLSGLYGMAPAADAMPRARTTAEHALSIDPNQVEALATLANIAAVYEWDLPRARALSDRAVQIDPTHVRALAERSIVLGMVANPSPALERSIVESVARAREVDPLNAWVAGVEAFCHIFAGRITDALAAAERSVALDESNFTGRWSQVFSLAAAGRLGDAEAAAAPALALSGRHPRILAELAALYARAGRRETAQKIWDEVRGHTGHVGLGERVAVAASAGDLVEARQLLRAAVEARDSYLAFWKLPAWGPACDDPECAALLRATPLFTSTVE